MRFRRKASEIFYVDANYNGRYGRLAATGDDCRGALSDEYGFFNVPVANKLREF